MNLSLLILILFNLVSDGLGAKLPTSEDVSDCLVWFNGCNNCKVLNGKWLDCTKMVCEENEATKCRYSKKYPASRPKNFDCTKSLTRRKDAISVIKDKQFKGEHYHFFLNGEPDNCPMDFCSLTDCQSGHAEFTHKNITINSRN